MRQLSVCSLSQFERTVVDCLQLWAQSWHKLCCTPNVWGGYDLLQKGKALFPVLPFLALRLCNAPAQSCCGLCCLISAWTLDKRDENKGSVRGSSLELSSPCFCAWTWYNTEGWDGAMCYSPSKSKHQNFKILFLLLPKINMTSWLATENWRRKDFIFSLFVPFSIC